MPLHGGGGGMGRVIAVANQKGGVGKTTTAVNVSAALALHGYRTLLVDMDPQSSATTGVGCRVPPGDPSIYEALVGSSDAASVLRPSVVSELDVLPATRDLVGADIELVSLPRREHRLFDAIGRLRGGYEFVLIDCPPSLSLLTINALRAADGVLVPLQAEYYALEGLTGLLDTIGRVRETLNPDLQLDGLLLTMFDRRNTLARQVEEEVRTHFGDRVLHTVVPRNVRLSESPSHGLPVLLYDSTSRGATAYKAVAGELVARTGGAHGAARTASAS
jgi:chromosome partitioning protein